MTGFISNTSLDIHVPVPDSDAYLILSFSVWGLLHGSAR
jgi:hypothetical protein